MAPNSNLTAEERVFALIASAYKDGYGELPALDDYTNTTLTSAQLLVSDMEAQATKIAELERENAELRADRDRDWILAIGAALGFESGFNVPIIPDVRPFQELFAAIRQRALRAPNEPLQGLPHSKWLALYHAVNKLMVVIGMHGQVERPDDRVTHVMAALHDIDGGEYKPLETGDCMACSVGNPGVYIKDGQMVCPHRPLNTGEGQ